MGGDALRIATRESPLALWQARHVAAELCAVHADLTVELVPMTTEGDRRTDVPLSEIGGKGVFAKEVQRAVLEGRADLAVHSAKDLPALTPDGLVIAATPPRADVRDALVGHGLADLPTGAVVATGSQRRRVQLAHLRGDLQFVDLRGNMATRLGRVADVDVDAVVVAAAALDRLDLGDRITEYLDPTAIVPQVGQGALAVECRSDDHETASLLSAIDDADTRTQLTAERSFLVELGGDCSLPAGAYAQVDGPTVVLRAVLAPAEWPTHPAPVCHVEVRGDDPVALGVQAAVALRDAVESLESA